MQRRKGFGQILFLIFLIAAAVGLIFGYRVYQEKHYISLFDGEMVRYIDVPPYANRVTNANLDWKGQATIELGTTFEQAGLFLGTMCSRRGFLFKKTDEGVEIEARPGYVVLGQYKDGKIDFRWLPIYTEDRKKQFEQLFPGETTASLTVPLPPVKKQPR